MIATILSVIASSVIAFFIAKWQMKKNKIVHFSINSYDIGKGLSNEFPEFRLHYNGDTLSDNVMVLKGGFMNVGRNDINALNGIDDIKLILPERCTVKAVKVLSATDGLTVNITFNNNVINFGISEILKSDEYFKYIIIVEISEEIKNLYDRISFNHRILNTDKIKNVYIKETEESKKSKFFKMVFIPMMIITILFSILSLMFSLNQNLEYKIIQKNTNEEVQLKIDTQSKLYIYNGIYIPFIDDNEISLEELNNNYSIFPVIAFNWNKVIPISVEILILIIYIVIFYYMVWGKNRHIINIIKTNENKS